MAELVYLTFDDGPNKVATAAILAELEVRRARARCQEGAARSWLAEAWSERRATSSTFSAVEARVKRRLRRRECRSRVRLGVTK